MNKLIVGIIIFVVVLLIYFLLAKNVSPAVIKHLIANWTSEAGI